MREDPECLAMNEQAMALYKLINYKPGIAIRHFNVGHCYKNIEAIRDLAESERHYRNAYSNYAESDALPRAQCLAQIAMIWLDRLEESQQGKLTAKLKQQLDAAVEQCERALQMMPADAWGDIGNLHNQLANALRLDPSRHEEALEHYRHSCQYAIAVGRYYEAATARGNFA